MKYVHYINECCRSDAVVEIRLNLFFGLLFLHSHRGVMLALSCGGVMLSVLASETCEFLYFEKEYNATIMDPPFDRASAGWIGIFQYSILKDENGMDLVDGCSKYENQFTRAPYEALIASQFCAVFAPALGMLAILISIIDLLCCTFYGSFVVTCVVFLIASGFQAGTFSIVAEPTFCFDSGVKCDVGKAAYFSGAAAVAFFISCVVVCCSPKPDPCYGKNRYANDDDSSVEEAPVMLYPEISATEQSPVTKSAGVSENSEGDRVQWSSY
jgi:hypothetical protein